MATVVLRKLQVPGHQLTRKRNMNAEIRDYQIMHIQCTGSQIDQNLHFQWSVSQMELMISWT